EYYFNRDGLYGFYDDCERYVFFSRAVLEMLRHISFKPDVISCNDWQTALIPVYYQVYYRYQQGYSNIRIAFTIHNIEYQGRYGKEVLNDLMGIPSYNSGLVEYDGYINLMKGAIETADRIITVSPSYSHEILDPWYAYGLDRILITKQHKLKGILNGIDMDLYNPEKDEFIDWHYSKSDISGKIKCRSSLLNELGFDIGDAPVIGIVSRLVKHKGIELIRSVFEEIIRSGMKFAILGSGEKIYEDFFFEMAKRYPERVSMTTGFFPELSHKIYAGADMFLMPSQTEPCGLAQMISMRYGTPPIVRETGGLRDTVRDNGGENGNGFTFKTYNADDMLDAVLRAKRDYDNKTRWNDLIIRAMSCNFDWNNSAETYIEVFEELINE
ncbi:MAG: glycogen synthase, partial [Ruminococcus sp.]|nr:glycogen synthase [Ruminococcus sp.]